MSAQRLIGLFRGSFSPELWNYGISDVRRGELRRTMLTESGKRPAPISPSGVSRRRVGGLGRSGLEEAQRNAQEPPPPTYFSQVDTF